MLKALREAKVNSSWISPNTSYENAITNFIEGVLTPGNSFLRDLEPFQKKISHYGMFNSLSQTLLKITSPGVPDFYQGTEIWDFSLVDPDNRRPVDYSVRMRMLEEIGKRGSEVSAAELARELTADKESGKIKLYMTYKALNQRRENREPFEKGEYIPLEDGGEKAGHICAFSRRSEKSAIVVVVPRFLTRVMALDALPLGEEVWGDTFVKLPTVEGSYHNIFTGESVVPTDKNGSAAIRIADLFTTFPVALLEMLG